MKNLLVNLAVIILVSVVGSAQTVFAQSANSNKETVSDVDHGYSFSVPANWNVEKGEGECAGVILTNPARNIRIVVKPHHSKNLADFIKDESNLAGKGFQRVGSVKNYEKFNYVRVAKQMDGSNIIVDIVFIPFTEKGGMALLNLTTSNSLAEEAMLNASDIIGSLKKPASTQSVQSPQTYPAQSTSLSSYRSLFAGKRYYFENPTSGYQFRMDFCSSGKFELNEMTRFGLDETTGSWTVQQNGGTVYLVLTSSQGQSVYAVTQGSRSGYLKVGEREYQVTSGSCR